MSTILPPFKIFSGTRSKYMAEEICKDLGVELGKMNIQYFADGEFEVCFEESIRGCEVYLVQSTFPNSDNFTFHKTHLHYTATKTSMSVYLYYYTSTFRRHIGKHCYFTS